MEIRFEYKGSVLKILLSGELDESNAEKVRSALDDKISPLHVNKIILDLSKLSFMDSTGIGVFVGRYRKFKDKPLAFFITQPNVTVDKILKLSGIYNIMPKIETA
ncbi:MAG: anti-sigma factor antagonist [Clostridia bacterium]|nr:anti-sigma factor antagonist [Clostridia bacterium]